MNLNDIRQGTLKEVFDALEEAFQATNTDFYIIGALARDTWYEKSDKPFIGTKDVDFAVLVGDIDQYQAVKDYLREHKNFKESKNNQFVMLAPEGLQIDILPFGGEMEIDEAVTVSGPGLNSIHVNGFQEVFNHGTEQMEIRTGHRFKIATLPAIVLLKLIAFDDRPEHRTKDARDITSIIQNFFEIQPDLVYTHSDLFEVENPSVTMTDIASVVIGREIRKIAESNTELMTRLRQILSNHIAESEKSLFVRTMVTGNRETVETTVNWLAKVLEGLNK
jgi:predicted nucleotidyltransferase